MSKEHRYEHDADILYAQDLVGDYRPDAFIGDSRRIAARYDKTARNYLSFVFLARPIVWLLENL
jgi:hypothetical protein